MKTIKEMKEWVALDRGYHNWKDVRQFASVTQMEHLMDLVTALYAEQFAGKVVKDDRYALGWQHATDAAIAAVKKNYEPTTPTAG